MVYKKGTKVACGTGEICESISHMCKSHVSNKPQKYFVVSWVFHGQAMPFYSRINLRISVQRRDLHITFRKHWDGSFIRLNLGLPIIYMVDPTWPRCGLYSVRLATISASHQVSSYHVFVFVYLCICVFVCCVFIFLYLYLCICICVFVNVYLYLCVSICVSLFVYLYLSICICVFLFVYFYLCICVIVFVCLYIHICVFVFVWTCHHISVIPGDALYVTSKICLFMISLWESG